MTHCSNCKATLKEGTKFCTSCGSPIKEVGQTRKISTGFTESLENPPKSPSKRIKKIIGLFAFIALFFIVRSLVTNIDISSNSMSISKALSKIEGEWHDPTGVLLGDKEAIITFRKRGDVIIGEDEDKTIYIQLLPYSKNIYSSLVVLNGNDDGFDAHYYKEEDKLVFSSRLNKTSWNIKKVKK